MFRWFLNFEFFFVKYQIPLVLSLQIIFGQISRNPEMHATQKCTATDSENAPFRLKVQHIAKLAGCAETRLTFSGTT